METGGQVWLLLIPGMLVPKFGHLRSPRGCWCPNSVIFRVPVSRSSELILTNLFLPACLTHWPPLILHYWVFPSSPGPLQTLLPLLGGRVFPQTPTSVNSHSSSPRQSHVLRMTGTSWMDYVLVFVLMDPLPFQQTIQDNLQVHTSEIFDGYQCSNPALD